MTTIVVTGKYTVQAGEALTFTDETAFVLGQPGGRAPTLVNKGSVEVTNDQTRQTLVGVSAAVESKVAVDNQAGGVFTFAATGKHAGITGFDLQGGLFNNAGEVDVTSDKGVATGLTDSGALDFHNSDTFQVHGAQTATGVRGFAGGSFSNDDDFNVTSDKQTATGLNLSGKFSIENSGDITVSGYDSAVGVALVGEGVFVNTGAIEVEATYYTLNTTGVTVSLDTGDVAKLTNEGSIDAYTAVSASGGKKVTLDNSGDITGTVELNSKHAEVLNSGSIHGVLYLGQGADLYQSTADGVVTGDIYAGLGDDQLLGGDGADRFYGDFDSYNHKEGGEDLLSGGGGDDVLDGGGGVDTLVGGAGSDHLEGGKGRDILVYQALSDSTVDAPDFIILQPTDTIDLSAIDADTTTAGDQAFTQVAAFDGHAGELTLVYDSSKYHTVLSLDVDGDGQSDFTAIILFDQHTFTGFVL